MNSTSLPSGNLRLATIHDIPRLSVVSTAGFFYSPTFEWERPYHHQYPEDTIKSYAKAFAGIIRDPERILLVVEDSYQPDENTKTGATIVSNPDENPQAGESVIVGFASWKLPPGSKYIGRYIDQDDLASDSKQEFHGSLDRDKEMARSVPLREAVPAQEEKNFPGRMVIELVAIHPAYWRRGHGKALLNWGIALAESEGVKTGVAANTLGVGLYLSMGFVEIGRFVVQDRKDPNNEITGVLLKHPT